MREWTANGAHKVTQQNEMKGTTIMSNRNYKATVKALQENNLQGQIITGKNPENAQAIIIDGYTFDKITHMNKASIMELCQNIACKGTKQAYVEYVNDRQSVALQKINIAHGRTASEVLENQLGQQMTYADSYSSYQFKGRQLKDCMLELVERTENNHEIVTDKHENLCYYKTWVQRVYGFYMDRDCKDWKNGRQIAERVMKELLSTKQVRLIGEHIYSNKALCEFVRCWEKANQYELPSRQDYVNKFIDAVNQEVGIG